MRLYYITLPRVKERYDYIRRHVQSLRGIEAHFVPGVDGVALSEEELHKLCTPEYISKVTRPEIGAALSHKKAWQIVAESEDKYAIIIEDDVVLPKQIGLIANKISEKIRPDDVVLMATHPYNRVVLSKQDAIPLDLQDPKTKQPLALYYPMTLEKLHCAAAYCIGREAARALLRTNTPLYGSADDWIGHFERGAIKRLLVLYPILTDYVGFQSTLAPYRQSQLNRFIVQLARKTKLPLFYNYLIWRARFHVNKLRKENIYFVEERSPFAIP